MLFLTSQNNSIYYDVYGESNAFPLLLIHGSTLTGQQDYCILSDTAHRFSKKYRVIVPDCRGHGRSSAVWRDESDGHATRLTYSFSEMSRDLAELLVALNASPAFVIGHSNGGNIALYMVKEQSQHVRAAVLLAANAYIDDHIYNRVPLGMNPDRVARDSQDWMNEMITLHDAHHGDGYWRDLLLATLEETITHPNWTKDDLKDIRVPCFVVQGENDAVNAKGKHAQTLHDWLPNSALWIPEGIGHSVHYELPDEFEQRVNVFFEGGSNPK
jgi:pimeloyl-ACP methyl ester carboxylesterase